MVGRGVGVSVGNGVAVRNGVSVHAGVDVAIDILGKHDVNRKVDVSNNKNGRMIYSLDDCLFTRSLGKMSLEKFQRISQKFLKIASVEDVLRALIINALDRHTGRFQKIAGLRCP